MLILEFLQYMGVAVYAYAGMPNNSFVCPLINDINNNCSTMGVSSRTPVDEIAKCKCHKTCVGYGFMVNGYDRVRHSAGKQKIYDFQLYHNIIFF